MMKFVQVQCERPDYRIEIAAFVASGSEKITFIVVRSIPILRPDAVNMLQMGCVTHCAAFLIPYPIAEPGHFRLVFGITVDLCVVSGNILSTSIIC